MGMEGNKTNQASRGIPIPKVQRTGRSLKRKQKNTNRLKNAVDSDSPLPIKYKHSKMRPHTTALTVSGVEGAVYSKVKRGRSEEVKSIGWGWGIWCKEKNIKWFRHPAHDLERSHKRHEQCGSTSHCGPCFDIVDHCRNETAA